MLKIATGVRLLEDEKLHLSKQHCTRLNILATRREPAVKSQFYVRDMIIQGE